MNEVAIIGIAGRFPEADSLDLFYKNLSEGKDSTRAVSGERILSTTIPGDKEYLPFAYMDDADKFDYKFFKIPHQEAIHMDPHQRMLLEIAYQTFESTGYTPARFADTKTAVILSDYAPAYYELAEKFDPTLITGSLSAFTAGRIARYFNLTGMAMMVNTTCSSSLVALHTACRLILTGEAEIALAGGVTLYLKPPEKNAPYNMGVISPDGKTRAFSADANGTGMGEGAACVLLKKLDSALEDGDIIYAVVKGSAVNQDAMRSGSLTAPSSKAQAEVITSAWENAGISPETISYIEAHGTATRLGDPVEISGIENAFRRFTDKTQFCALSSVKSNVGHSGNIAGMISLSKVVMSLRHKKLLPAANFSKPSPFINFNKLPVYINTSLADWTPQDGAPLRAGVSSFGLMGTNCHVVLEAAPEKSQASSPGPFLFCLSARTDTALEKKRFQLCEAILTSPQPLQNVSYTLNAGKEHFDYRISLVAANAAELVASISRQQITPVPERRPKVIFLCSGTVPDAARLLQEADAEHPLIASAINHCTSILGNRALTPVIAGFMIQYAFLQASKQAGINMDSILGIGTGEHVVSAFLEETSLEEAMDLAELEGETVPEALEARLTRLIDTETAQAAVLFIETAPGGAMGLTLKKEAQGRQHTHSCRVIIPGGTGGRAFLNWIGDLYLQGLDPDWSALYRDIPVSRAILPLYPFDKTRCWIREMDAAIPVPRSIPSTASQPQPAAVTDALDDTEGDYTGWTQMEASVARIWQEVLRKKQIGRTDDFFTIGGNSLLAARIISRIEQQFLVKLRFRDIYIFATIKTLAAGIEKLIGEKNFTNGLPPLVKAPEKKSYELSFAQRRLWILDKMEDGDLLSYNAPYTLLLEGELNIAALEKAFNSLVARHEILRTIITESDGHPYQEILESLNIELEQLDIAAAADADEGLQQIIAARTAKPFDLSTGPMLRASLIRMDTDRHVLLLILHHIISDGWSIGVFLKEIYYLYSHFEKEDQELPEPLQIQYKDYSEWHNRLLADGSLGATRDYWHKQLSALAPAELPLDYPRGPVRTYAGDTLTFDIDKEKAEQLKQIGREAGASLFSMLTAIVDILLYHYSGQEEQVTGSPVAGRIHPLLEPLIGFFVNTLALRNRVAPGASFRSFLAQVHATTLDALEHQAYPFDLLVEEIDMTRSRNRNPLFDVMVVLQNNELEDVTFGKLRISAMKQDFKVSLFDLMCSFWEVPDGRITAAFNYNTQSFEKESVLLFSEQFNIILDAIIEDPEKPVATILSALAPVADQAEMQFNF